jgi:hypothetical protein
MEIEVSPLKFNFKDKESKYTIQHIMDPGSHVGFQISTKNTNLVEDHPVNISGKFG